MDEKSKTKPMGQVIQIDEARIRDHLCEMVRGTGEEALNAMLDAEADRLCGDGRYERGEARSVSRSICIVACGGEVVGAFLQCEDVNEAADRAPEAVDGALGSLSQQRLELGDGHFNWVEVGAVWRKEGEPCASGLDHSPDRGALVAGKVIHDHDVAGVGASTRRT